MNHTQTFPHSDDFDQCHRCAFISVRSLYKSEGLSSVNWDSDGAGFIRVWLEACHST